jgi:hypothetical protein
MNSQFIKIEPSNFSGMARDKASQFFPSTAFLRSKKAKGWLGMVGNWGQG